jgi:putative ABC transport system substrate-binding protein
MESSSRGFEMRRREFITLLGGATVTRPFAARAQQAGSVHRVALIFPNAALSDMSGSEPTNRYARAFVHALRNLGYAEGSNLVLERRSAEGKYERFAEIAAELIRNKIDVIVAGSNPAIESLKRVTSTVPVVMAPAIDPVEAGLVKSLARPGGNITGFVLDPGPGIEGRRLQLLKEAVPVARRISFLGTKYEWEQVGQDMRAAAKGLGVTVFHAELIPSSYAEAFSLIARDAGEAILGSRNGAHFVNRQLIAKESISRRLPGLFTWRDITEAGGLMSYGADYSDILRGAAGYVDRILKGAKSADLPVQQPTKYELVINLGTAKALGLTVSPTLLARADEVIE